MIVKLKTIEQLEEEFGFKFNGKYYTTIFNEMLWGISKTMFKQLDKEIEVEKLEDGINYTHYDNEIGCYWHESWFEPEFVPIDFIKEDEFEI